MTPASIVGFYGAVLGVAHLWDALRTRHALVYVIAETVWRDLAVGIAIGLGIAGVAAWLGRRLPSMRALEHTLAAALGRLSPALIALAAVASGVAEEAFFRGALQASTGLVVASLVFGAAHGFFAPPLRAWSVFATAIGFILGALFDATGCLAAPIAAHVTVNAVGLVRLSRAAARQV